MASILHLPPRTNFGLPRVDGPLKVTGAAKYTSDHNLPGMLYAVPVCATIAKGTITAIDSNRAQSMPGVKAVYTRQNIGKLFRTVPASGFFRNTGRTPASLRGRHDPLLRTIRRRRGGKYFRTGRRRSQCG